MGKIIDDIPRDYWKDSDWAYEQIDKLVSEYPNQFVAIHKKQVIGVGRSSTEAREKGKEKVGNIQFPIIFMEIGNRIYANRS